MKRASYTTFVTTVVFVAVWCITFTYGMAEQCIKGSKIVTACTNHSVPTDRMFIPVNGSIDQGCSCDVIIFQATDNSTFYSLYMKHANRVNISCGYKVDIFTTNNNYSITCSEFGSRSNTLKLNQRQRLRFTTHHAPDPTNTTGFCLSVSSQENVLMKMDCWDVHNPTPLTASTTSIVRTPSTNTAQQSRTSILPVSTSPITSNSESSTIVSLTTTTSTTKNAHVQNSKVAAIGGSIGGGILLLLVIIVIICLCRRRRNNNCDKPSDRITESTNYNNLRVKDEMVILDNDLYVSYDDKYQSTASPTSDLQHVQASVHNTLEKSNPKPVQIRGYVTTDVQPSGMTADHIKSIPSPDDMIILENDLYLSADSIPNSAADNYDKTSDEQLDQTEFALKPNQGVSNGYAVVNKTRKPNQKPAKRLPRD
ncbi:uncharacterized protein LOC126830854 isoform X1 [Patella vulgata]|uniref:uncharacterized protein LOC126830854 isoform X1 n=1 Tax=Patella vulgata TaxID=6465 RepID=UPI00217F2BA8|nr:uncharacterized protein LOC126830854 isoform X1 [Patella vulgata]